MPNVGGSLSLTSCRAGRFGNCCCPWVLERGGCHTSLGMHSEFMLDSLHLNNWFSPSWKLSSKRLPPVTTVLLSGQCRAISFRCISAYKKSFMYLGVRGGGEGEGRTDHIHYAKNN